MLPSKQTSTLPENILWHTIQNINTKKTTENILNTFIQFCIQNGYNIQTIQDLTKIDLTTIAKFYEYLHQKKYAPRTINLYIQIIKNIYDRLEIITNTPNPISILKKNKVIRLHKVNNTVKRDFLLTPQEIKTMLSIMPRLYKNEFEKNRDILLIKLLAQEGLRISEALSITKNQIQNNKKYIEITGKGKKIRTIIIPEKLKKEILAFIQKYKIKDKIFLNLKGKPLSRTHAHFIIKRAGKLIGKNISPHCLRHSFATNLLAKTNKIKAIANHLGHTNIQTTLQMYIHEEITEKELEKINY